MTCEKARFLYNNYAGLTLNSINFSSEKVGYEGLNALNDFRSSYWIPTGNFEITTSNQNIYINDGADKTAVITAGSYATPTLLASQIQTQLNTVSSAWTVTYNAVAGEYKFRISRSVSATLKLSTTTNAAWATLGYISSIDQVGLLFEADLQINHTSEYIIFDFGFQANITATCIIGAVNEDFNVSTAGLITLKGNNINDFSSPPFIQTLTYDKFGSFNFFNNVGYRYYKLEVVDKQNPSGPEGNRIGNIYLGDYVILTARNISSGFQHSLIDPSNISESESGVLFFDRKVKYKSVDNISFIYIKPLDKKIIEDMYRTLGKTTPFYISLDPGEGFSNELSDFTIFCVMTNDPQYTHIISDYFDATIQIREVI